MNKILASTSILFLLSMSIMYSQWNDGGTWIRTDDNVGIGSQTNAHSLYVRSNKAGWQAGFINRAGAGANIYLSHGAGYGMHVRGRTTDSKYTFELANLNERTNIFYNNGNVGLGLVGNVGIGTASPAEKLHINGAVRGNVSGALRISTGFGYVDVGPKNSSWAHFVTDRPRFYFNKEIRVATGMIGSYNTNLILRTQGTTRMTVLKSNGNVGIGTASPAHKLHVNGGLIRNSHTTPGIEFNETDKNVTWRGIVGGDQFLLQRNGADQFVVNNQSQVIIKNSLINNGSADFKIVAGHTNGRLLFQTNGQNRLTIHKNGRVIIGNVSSTPAGYNLCVDQGILTEKVIVAVQNTSDWADYVFEDEYELMPLEEVEAYIQKNQHLPGVPSAEEVVKSGINVAEMDALLLKKLEESQLYILELHKELSTLKDVVRELQKKID